MCKARRPARSSASFRTVLRAIPAWYALHDTRTPLKYAIVRVSITTVLGLLAALVLPGAQGFKVAAGGDGVKQQVVGCLATEREIYNDLPPPLRWGDFEDIKLGTFEEIRDAFAQVAKAPVALEGATIEVLDSP